MLDIADRSITPAVFPEMKAKADDKADNAPFESINFCAVSWNISWVLTGTLSNDKAQSLADALMISALDGAEIGANLIPAFRSMRESAHSFAGE